MKVHNINGTSDNKCKCGSWRAHWEKFNERSLAWPRICSEKSCINPPTLGAHVQKENFSTAKWYIIPFCDKHNKCVGESLDVREGTSFAPANRSETCEKTSSESMKTTVQLCKIAAAGGAWNRCFKVDD
ncbi:MAG: hypothetical protein ACI4R9_07295 [Kiritimatiellia bacterium]